MQELAERRSQGRVLERQFHGGDEKAELVARIMPLPLDFVGEHGGMFDELAQGIRELNLSVLARRGLAEDRENFRGQDIASDDREIRRCVGRGRFLHQIVDAVEAIAHLARGDDAVPADFLLWYLLHTQDRAFALLVDMDQLGETGNGRVDDFVSEDDGERFVADQMLCAEDRMSESHGFRLPDVAKVGQIGNVPHLIQHLALAAALQILFQLEGTVEVVFDRAFTSAGDDDDVFDARRDGFFDDVLNQRFVDQRKHLFGRSLGGGEKACTQSGCGNNSFTYIGSDHRAIVCEGVGEVKISSALYQMRCRARDAGKLLYIEKCGQYNPRVFLQPCGGAATKAAHR